MKTKIRTLLLVVLLSVLMVTPSAAAAPVMSGTFSGSILGLVVCVRGDGIHHCFKAHLIDSGPDAGKAEVVWARGQVLTSADSSLADGGILTSSQWNGSPSVGLSGEVPGVGSVDIVSIPDPGGLIEFSNLTCPGDGIQYVLRASEPVIYSAARVQGTINDARVANFNSCGSHFVGATDGTWWTPSAGNATG